MKRREKSGDGWRTKKNYFKILFSFQSRELHQIELVATFQICTFTCT